MPRQAAGSRGRSVAAIAAIALVLVGCTGAPPEAAQPEPSRDGVPGSASDVSAAVHKWLELQAVAHASAGRRVLYSWTGAAGAAELARTKDLLVAHPEKGTMFEADVCQHDPKLCELLRRPQFAKRRYAWSNPWATARGFGDERYGDRLIRIVLKEDALVLTDGAGVEGMMNTQGTPAFTVNRIRSAQRIAAVYHVHAASDAGLPFREYVIVNEAAIEEWSIGTDDIARRVALDAEMLHHIAAREEALGNLRAPSDVAGWTRSVVDESWTGVNGRPSDASLYASGLAFVSLAYGPHAPSIRAIADQLAALPPQGPPVVHRADVKFEPIVEPPPPPPVPCVPRGSECVPIRPPPPPPPRPRPR